VVGTGDVVAGRAADHHVVAAIYVAAAVAPQHDVGEVVGADRAAARVGADGDAVATVCLGPVADRNRTPDDRAAACVHRAVGDGRCTQGDVGAPAGLRTMAAGVAVVAGRDRVPADGDRVG